MTRVEILSKINKRTGPIIPDSRVYINDSFYFVKDSKLTNYVEGNTLFTTNTDFDLLSILLESDIYPLKTLFESNYLKLNASKCHLLVSNKDDSIPINVGNEVVKGGIFVKLLGVTIDNQPHSEHRIMK